MCVCVLLHFTTMNKLEKLEALFETMAEAALEVLKQADEALEVHLQSFIDQVKKDVEEYESTGILPSAGFDSVKKAEEAITEDVLRGRGRPKGRTTASVRASSIKENNSELANKADSRKTGLNAHNSNGPTNKFLDKAIVKMERITESFSDTTQTLINVSNIKKEPEEMPPPSRPPIKRMRTRRATQVTNSMNIDLESVVIKQEIIEKQPLQNKERESDVVLQTDKVLNVTIIDSDDERPAKTKPPRTRTKKRQLANTDSSASNDSENEIKKQRQEIEGSARSTRTRTRNAAKKENEEAAEEATPLNKTVVVEKPNNLNVTTVISKNAHINETFMVDNKKPANLEKQMSDDIIENSVTETKPTKQKQIFSPYAGSPVKKRVAAFEKLGVDAQAETNAHSTRGKAKKLFENAVSEDDDSPTNHMNKKTSGIPKLRGTPTVENRLITVSSAKPKSALKPLTSELRERELRRKQKEAEALQKKEALINAQLEEKRLRNEERRLKAQQQRDAMEKEKQQTLELAERAKRAKQDKLKIMLAEKEDKLLKQKEEANKKRLVVLKKAALEKEREEKRKLEEAKKQGNKQPVKTEPPLLPTPDCYDSDDSTNASKRIEKPVWQNSRSLYIIQKNISFMDEIKKKLFSCKPQYPDVSLIFPGSKPVKRNSSVIWDASTVSKNLSILEEEDDD